MNAIERLFDSLDKWRHFPCYQLERRADIFFSLYLPEVLEKRFKVPMHPVVIPEFPIYKDLVLRYASTDDRKCLRVKEDEGNLLKVGRHSYKIDYLMVARDHSRAFLVELKTDPKSRRIGQDVCMKLAISAGLEDMLNSVKELFIAQKEDRSKRLKYYHMIKCLKGIGLVDYSSEVDEIMLRKNHKGIYEVFESYSSVELQCSTEAVYLEPFPVDESGIGFDETLVTVDRYDDPLSRRFGESLRKWMKPAGSLEN